VQNILTIILNYILMILKVIGISFLCALPFFIIIKLLNKKYLKLKKKTNQIISVSIIFYIINAIILILIYFVPIIGTAFKTMTTINIVVFFIYHIIRLLLINILLTGIFMILSLITFAIYDKLNKKNNFTLIKSLTITNIICFVLLLIFPKIIAIIIYLIYL